MSQTSINAAGQPVGRKGQLADNESVRVLSRFSEEATDGIVFGSAVGRGAAERGILNLAATTDDVVGVAVYAMNHALGTGGDLDDDGNLAPAAPVDVLEKGRIYVEVEEAVVAGDWAFTRAVVTGSEVRGAWRKSADASDMIDLTGVAKFQSSAAAGGLAILEVDFTNAPS